MVTLGIVAARLDYCNSLLYGTCSYNLRKLQVTQNALVRIVCQAARTCTISTFWLSGLSREMSTLPIHSQIQNQSVTRRSVQAKKTESEAREATVIMGVISVRGVKEFAFKIAFKTTDRSCSTTVKRQVIPDLWRSDRKCLVRHDEGRGRMVKQQFVRRSQ